MTDHTELIQAALAVRELAHAPFSKFPVGAALQSFDGAIITGDPPTDIELAITAIGMLCQLSPTPGRWPFRFQTITVPPEPMSIATSAQKTHFISN